MKNFHSDLARGKTGETTFLLLFNKLQPTDGRTGDFLTPGGEKLELKTDSYSFNKTGNFFIERYSSIEVLSPGGPWQAKAHGCKYFAYYYINEQVGWVWETDALVLALDSIVGTLKPTEVKNRKWTTVGFKVPRTALQNLALFSFSKGGVYGNVELACSFGLQLPNNRQTSTK